MFVLDASVTMAWCFADESDAYTIWVLQRCREESVCVPSIWPIEVTNVLCVGERTQRITPADSARFLTLLADLPIRVGVPIWPRTSESVLALARRHQLTAYDASYLAHALKEQAPLATRDDRLQQAAHEEGIRILSGPT